MSKDQVIQGLAHPWTTAYMDNSIHGLGNKWSGHQRVIMALDFLWSRAHGQGHSWSRTSCVQCARCVSVMGRTAQRCHINSGTHLAHCVQDVLDHECPCPRSKEPHYHEKSLDDLTHCYLDPKCSRVVCKPCTMDGHFNHFFAPRIPTKSG